MEQNQNPQQFNAENQQVHPLDQGLVNHDQQAVPFYQEYQQPTYTSAAAKKKINPAAIIIPVAILAVAATVVLLILLLSGNGGYKGAEGRYISQMFGGLSSVLDETEKVSNEPQSVTVSFEASNSQISNYIGISDITFTTETAINGKDIYAHMGLAFGDNAFNGKFWFDGENSNVLMALPEISSVYLQANVSVEEEAGQELTIDTEKAMEALNDIVSRTMEVYFEVVGDVEIQGGQTLMVNGEAYTADKVEIKLDPTQLAAVVKAFLESFVNNDDAMDILCTYYGADKEEVLEMLDIDGAIEELEDFIEKGAESSAALEMTVWMQGGEIVGRDVTITDDDGYTVTEFSFYQIPVADGTVTYFEIPDEYKLVNFDSVSGVLHSGTLTVSDGYDEVSVEYKDMAITDTLFQGEAKVVVTGSEAFEITVVLETEGDVQTVMISVPNICKVTVTAEPSQLSFEDRPQLSEGQVAVIDSSGEFYDDEAFDQFLNDVLGFVLGSDLYL